MDKIELTNASAPISEYALEAEHEQIVIVTHGKPTTAVFPLLNTHAETVTLSTNKNFIAIIENHTAE